MYDWVRWQKRPFILIVLINYTDYVLIVKNVYHKNIKPNPKSKVKITLIQWNKKKIQSSQKQN